MNEMERYVYLALEEEGEDMDVLVALSDDDILDIAMLRGDAVDWTATRVVELIDWRREHG